MAPLFSVLGVIAIISATSCGAFLAPPPIQRISRDATASNALGGLYNNDAGSRVLSKTIVDLAPHVGGGLFSRKGLAGFGDQRQQAARALKAVPGAGGEEGEVDAGRDLSGFRRALLLSFWLPFTAYAFGPWSPGGAADPKNFELVTTLFDPALAGPQTAIFYSIFNAFPPLVAVLASVLCGGGAFDKNRQPVPPQPFVFGAFAFGFFALAPYLALRNYLPEVDADEEDASKLEKVLTSKLFAVPVLGLSVYCVGTLLASLQDPEAVAAFVELFKTSRLVHISTLDITALSVTLIDPLREDMRRRGWEPEVPKVALFSVPIVGPALWLLVRPAVVRE